MSRLMIREESEDLCSPERPSVRDSVVEAHTVPTRTKGVGTTNSGHRSESGVRMGSSEGLLINSKHGRETW